MTWQLAAFAILFLALAGGFAWYERARPDSRLVALVATLAALAALGRIAFAALPNVKPTTDIVLISGYTLGAGPGFAVGALAGLTSNFFFGQGPWTPWQMAAWGATGLLGAGWAALARGRPLRRWPLAVVCGGVGFAFTAVQDLGDWVTYSDHSLAQLGVYVSKGVGFDVVHAVGCVVFALLFGPSLGRSITRFAARLQVSWRLPGEAVLPVTLAALGLAALVAVAPARAGSGPVSYLESAQNGDGGLGAAPGQTSQSLYAGWAALGLASQGVNPRTVSRGGPSLTDYIAGQAGSSDPGDIERTILALSAAGISAHSVAGHDLVAELEGKLRPDGSIQEQVNLTAFAILALRAAGTQPGAASLAWLSRQQDSDGGFNYATAGGSSDIDDTGAALEALAGSGDAAAVGRAVAFLHGNQNPDGGFPSSPGQDSNAQSTAWAIQGLLAVGVDPGTFHHAGAESPLQYLQSLVAPDGHVRYSRSEDQTPVWVTSEAMMALAGKPLPLAAPNGPAQSTQPAGPRRHPRGVSGRHRHRTATIKLAVPGGGLNLANRLASDLGILIRLSLAPVGAS